MFIKKGPFGYFAVERFDSPECIFSYAGEVIDRNRSGCLLPCSIDVSGISSSAYFDFSGLISIRQAGSALTHNSRRSKKLSKILDERRRSAGDFFCSIPVFLDNLISPSAFVLDPDYVFTDDDGSFIKFCLLPFKYSPDLIRLTSLNAEHMESFLSEPFFDGVLTNDEKQELIYSIKTDDESLFLKCAKHIRDTTTDNKSEEVFTANTKPAAPIHLPERSTQKRSRAIPDPVTLKPASELLWSWISAIASGVSMKFSGLIPAILFYLVSGVFLIRFFMSRRTKKDKAESDERSLSGMRSMILFSEGDGDSYSDPMNDLSGSGPEPSHSVTPLVTGTLTAMTAKDGKMLSYSLMMDRTTIGSDVFLSDIVIDDPSVDAIHAIIYLSGKTFYISDCSRKGTTYIDDRKTACGRKCEIKNGQKITIGTVDFRFKVLLPSVGQAWTSELQSRNAQ
ncbi:MAG: FHA domain-containing protein [Ruminococcaceae bacterium]|nr:FHA domain-containing protein [Oscillospiraceae bacterium]